MNDLTSENVRWLMQGKTMTAGDVAKNGGWDFEDVCNFFNRNAQCDEVDVVGFKRVMLSGVGTAFTWVPLSEGDRYAKKRFYDNSIENINKRCQIILTLIDKMGESILKVDCDIYGWGNSYLFPTTRKLLRLGMIEKCGKKGRFLVYRLTEKGRDEMGAVKKLEAA